MSDPAQQIADQMQIIRGHVGDDVKGIVESAKTLTDWRYHVKHHPWMSMGLSLAAGFMLMPGKKSVVTGDAKELVDLLRQGKVNVTPNGVSTNGGLLRTLTAALGPVLFRTAMNFASQRMSQGDWAAGASPTAADTENEHFHENVSGL